MGGGGGIVVVVFVGIGLGAMGGKLGGESRSHDWARLAAGFLSSSLDFGRRGPFYSVQRAISLSAAALSSLTTRPQAPRAGQPFSQ